MKKIILSAFLLGAILVTKNTMAQVTVGPKIGLNLSQIIGKDGAEIPDPKSRVGFQIGGMLNAEINDYFAIRPELLFNNVGSKYESNSTSTVFNTNYLSLPINFVGQYPISDKFKIQGFVGPYAALGLGGTYKSKSPYEESEGSIKMKKNPLTNTDDVYLNSMDFGLNFGLGFQFTSFVFTANYALGLTNIDCHYKDAQYEEFRGNFGKIYNRNITFGVAYLFGGE